MENSYDLLEPSVFTSSSSSPEIYRVSNSTIEEGQRLYKCHFRHEVKREDLSVPEFMLLGKSPFNMTSLIALADQFRASPQRQWVYEQAESVELESLNFQTFRDLLSGLFREGGVTWERVLVLFFFCTDLTIRAIREKLNDFMFRIYDWTTSYIASVLSLWVEQQGGWSVVLSHSVSYRPKLITVTVCCIVLLAVAFFIARNRQTK